MMSIGVVGITKYVSTFTLFVLTSSFDHKLLISAHSSVLTTTRGGVHDGRERLLRRGRQRPLRRVRLRLRDEHRGGLAQSAAEPEAVHGRPERLREVLGSNPGSAD